MYGFHKSGNDYARNKIRNQVIPALNEINTQAAAHISQTAAYAAMYDTYVTKQVGHFLDEHMEIRKQTGKQMHMYWRS